MVTVEEIRRALEQIKYPGYSRSIISFNIVREIRLKEDSIEVELQLTTDKEEVITALRNGVERIIAELTGLPVNIVVTTPSGTTSSPGNQNINPFEQRSSIPGVKNIVAGSSG